MERVVVENNNLGAVLRAGEKALEVCAKNARCRSGLNELGLLKGLTNEQVEEAMKAGITQDPAVIATLTAAQIAYLDAQIKSGTGMAGLMLGSHTWSDRLNLPSNTGGNQIASPGPTDTGGNQQLDPNGRPTHTGNDNGHIDKGISHTGGNQIVEQSSSNTGNTESVPSLPNHMVSDGHDNGAEKPSNIKMADDKYLKNNGVNAHSLKEDFLGDGKNSNYDIYVDRDSGQLWIFKKGGKGDDIPTGEFIK